MPRHSCHQPKVALRVWVPDPRLQGGFAAGEALRRGFRMQQPDHGHRPTGCECGCLEGNQTSAQNAATNEEPLAPKHWFGLPLYCHMQQ